MGGFFIRYVLIFIPLFMFGQKKVESKAFDLLLSGMLKKDIPILSVDELNRDSLANYQLVDSREQAEYQVSHLPNATWVGFEDFDLSRVAELNKNKPVLVYCSIGVRSEKIGRKLKEAGFKEVYNLYGGIFEWFNQKQNAVDSTGTTGKIHGYSKVWSIWLNQGEIVY